MKEAPFNPIPVPDLNLQSAEPAVAKPTATKSTRRKAPSRTTSRRTSRISTTRRVMDPKASAIRFARKVSRKAKTSWKRIKGGINSRLGHLDREQLKNVLLACGIAAALVAAIILLIKMTPLIVTLLAVLGLAVVIQIWDRLRLMRIPS
jgi:hypothetical protein